MFIIACSMETETELIPPEITIGCLTFLIIIGMALIFIFVCYLAYILHTNPF